VAQHPAIRGTKLALIEKAKDQDARMLRNIRVCRSIVRTLQAKVLDAGRLQDKQLEFALRWACETLITAFDAMERDEVEDVETHRQWSEQERIEAHRAGKVA